MSKAEPGSIQESGANTFDVLEGMTDKNIGLRLRVKQPQTKYRNGSVEGRFEILDAGTGYYSEQIKPIVGQTMNAKDFAEAVLSAIPSTKKTKLTVLDLNSLRLAEIK